MRTKVCHAGLKPRSRFLGLEPIDILLLFPGFYLCSIILGKLILAIVISIVTGAALHFLKWGRLPNYSLALFEYLTDPRQSENLGSDSLPMYREEK